MNDNIKNPKFLAGLCSFVIFFGTCLNSSTYDLPRLISDSSDIGPSSWFFITFDIRAVAVQSAVILSLGIFMMVYQFCHYVIVRRPTLRTRDGTAMSQATLIFLIGIFFLYALNLIAVFLRDFSGFFSSLFMSSMLPVTLYCQLSLERVFYQKLKRDEPRLITQLEAFKRNVVTTKSLFLLSLTVPPALLVVHIIPTDGAETSANSLYVFLTNAMSYNFAIFSSFHNMDPV